MRFHRLLAALLAAGLLATGCSGGGQPAAGPTRAPAANPTSAPAPQPTKAAAAAGSPTQAPTAARSATAPAPTTKAGAGMADLETVPMPSGGTKYDGTKPVKVGDVLDLPLSGLVLQVTGTKTVAYEGQKELLLVELIIGNKGKDKADISSALMMSAVTGDWHWYGLGLNMDEIMKVSALVGPLKVRTFDGEVGPGQARKGTAALPVPKDARQIAFAFEPMNSADILAKSDPTVYVPLGIRGEFQLPIIADDVPAVKAGTTYKVGQAVKAPKRGVAIQVNGIRERLDPVPNSTLAVTSKYIIVDVTTRTFGDSKQLTTGNELVLTGADGKSMRPGTGEGAAVPLAESTRSLRDGIGRGVIVFLGSRDAKNYNLKFRPMDPASPVLNPKYMDDETITFDLSGAVTQAPSASASAAAPKLGDPSTIPAEIKEIGVVPPGFAPEEGSAKRESRGGNFSAGKVTLFGRGTVKDVVAFYQKTLENGWEDNGVDVTEHAAQLEYFDIEEGTTNIELSISEYAGGIRVAIEMMVNS